MKIAIAAATGNIGSRTARRIADAGANTILLGRDLVKLEKLKVKNAVCVATDLSDSSAVIKATAGADAMLWLVPPASNYPSLKESYEKVIESGVEAVRANDIKELSQSPASARAAVTTWERSVMPVK